MKIAAFDLETAKQFPDRVDDLKRYAPLGVTCAAVAFSDGPDLLVWQGAPQLSREECHAIVHKLRELVAAGYTLVTWNGCGFDFFVLAQESGMVGECGELALGQVDLMAIVTFTKGHFLGLEKALKGAGLAGKTKRVKLSDGTVLHGMSGARAPALWAAGEHEAVLAYLREDVLQLVELAEFVDRTKAIYWRSNADAPQAVEVKRLMSVKECFGIPEPDVSWMSNPPSRQSFVDWIPGWQERVGIRQPVEAKPTPPVTPAASGMVQQQPTTKITSNKRGCLYAVGVFVLLTVVVLLLTGIASDGVVGCCAVSVIPVSVASFFVFRVKKAAG